MSYVTDAFALKAKEIIKNLEKRNMEGYFCKDSTELLELVLPMLKENASISWGGSESLKESGLLDALHTQGSYELIDRTSANSPEESRTLYAKTVLSDYYFMSTNAITLEGELVNIDGNGNRVACLIQGPREVFIICGMNKVVSDIGSGLSRVQNSACAPNTIRLNKNTPCAVTGSCKDCLSPDCICNQIVITRRSGHKGRIKVFLVAENLGF